MSEARARADLLRKKKKSEMCVEHVHVASSAPADENRPGAVMDERAKAAEPPRPSGAREPPRSPADPAARAAVLLRSHYRVRNRLLTLLGPLNGPRQTGPL